MWACEQPLVWVSRWDTGPRLSPCLGPPSHRAAAHICPWPGPPSPRARDAMARALPPAGPHIPPTSGLGDTQPGLGTYSPSAS